MKCLPFISLMIFFHFGNPIWAFAQLEGVYPICQDYDRRNKLANRIPAPEGFTRLELTEGSFGDWLRSYPLLPGTGTVLLHNGEPKSRQDVHHAVLDLPLSQGDLQQCADAVIRMRAEYLYQAGLIDAIFFKYTSGDKVAYSDWISGKRPLVSGNRVSWKQIEPVDANRESLESYLRNIFTYAGSHSLQAELIPVDDGKALPGDVLIEGGFPGHAMLVMDVAENSGGDQIVLLAQSFMPAQQMHIVKNTTGDLPQPWISFNNQSPTHTPQWTFQPKSLYRFP